MDAISQGRYHLRPRMGKVGKEEREMVGSLGLDRMKDPGLPLVGRKSLLHHAQVKSLKEVQQVK
jgi:hypothetical protein